MRYILLRSLNSGFDPDPGFFVPHDPKTDQTRDADGRVAFEIIGFANTVSEAQRELLCHTLETI